MAETIAKISSKEYLEKNAKAKTKIKWRDRKKVEIVKATKHYKVGDIVKAHSTWADFLIEKGIAKEYVAKKK